MTNLTEQELAEAVAKIAELDAKRETIGCQATFNLFATGYREAASIIAQLWSEREANRVVMVKARDVLDKITHGNVAGYPGIAEDFRETYLRELVAKKDIAAKALGELNNALGDTNDK